MREALTSGIHEFCAAVSLAAALMLLGGCWGAGSLGTSTTNVDVVDPNAPTVFYTSDGFDPKRVEIEAGQQVRFVNESDHRLWPASNIHPTHGILPDFDAKAPVAYGESWVFRFDKPGFWRYHNHMTPEDGGLIVVSPDALIESVRPLVPDIGDLTFDEPTDVSLKDYLGILKNDAQLRRFVERYGPGHTVRLLSEAAVNQDVDCHQRAHVLGRIAYEVHGAAAFAVTSHECQAGGFHGAMEALFRDRGTTNLTSDVEAICGDQSRRFYKQQCVHGIGHGIMAWTTYELPDALALCDELEEKLIRVTCYSGVFMENVVGGIQGTMGHFSEYLSDDPHFPCNSLDPRYVEQCYFYQTSRMLLLYNFDYAKIAAQCTAAPNFAQSECFQSLGRDIGYETRGDPVRAINLCGAVEDPTDRASCLDGAAQDRFWDPSGAAEALIMCGLIDYELGKRACYWRIIERAVTMYESAAALRGFCLQIEKPYDAWCLRDEG